MMFKKLTVLLTLMLFLFSSYAFGIDIYIDGQALQMDVPAQTIEGRTLVPLRAIFEAMDATVNWDSKTQTATGIKGDTTVILPLGSLSPTINGQTKPLDVPTTIVSGRTLAPLRFVGEAFGGSVRWDGSTQTIYITSPRVQSSAEIKVHYIDVGQADSIYIDLPNNNDILIDAGNRGDGTTVVNYLKTQGVDDIELLIATHPHEDHIGGLPNIYDAFLVEQTIDSGYFSDSQICAAFKQAATAEGNYVADNKQNFTFGNATLNILTGDQTWEDCNDYSVVCRLDTGDIEFIFTGDAETPVEEILTGELDSEILKIGHHGSNSSTSQAFLNKVKPEIAIISCGTDNKYGHPHQETLSKLENAGVAIYRTDLNGNIIVTTDGHTYSVATQKNITLSTQPTTQISKGKYVGSIKSNKYHLPTCRYAEKIDSENQIWFTTEEEAIAKGYSPCGVCKP